MSFGRPLTVSPTTWMRISLGFYTLLAILFSVLIPLGEAPDEVSHYTIIQFIARHARLPVGSEVPGPNQPPLYYIIGAVVMRGLGGANLPIKANVDFRLDDPSGGLNVLLHTRAEDFPYTGGAFVWHTLRLLSVAFGAGTILGVYHLGRVVFPQPWLAVGTASLVATLPGFVAHSAMVTNDILVAFLGTWGLVYLARWVRGDGPRVIVPAGILIGLAVLAKASALTLVLLLPVAAALRAWVYGHPRRVLQEAGRILIIAALIGGWWLARNLVLYRDLLGWSHILAVSDLRIQALSPGDIVWLIQGLHTSFWGRFGGAVHIRYPDWLYALLVVVPLASAIGYGRWVMHNRLPVHGGSWLLSLAMAAGTFVSLVVWTATVLGTDQARLLFVALGPLAILLVTGLAALVPESRYSIVVRCITLGLLILSGMAIITIHQAFTAPNPLL